MTVNATAELSVRKVEGELLIGVRVSPAAARTAVRGLYGQRLKVSLSSPPEDGRANRELVGVLAGWLELRRDDVRIEAGHGSRDKIVAIVGMEEAELRSKIASLVCGTAS